MDWFDKWRGSLAYSVEELNFSDEHFSSLLVSHHTLKTTEELISSKEEVEGKTYYVIGKRGSGKSTTLNYMMRIVIDNHIKFQKELPYAFCILCSVPGSVSPLSTRELSDNIILGVLKGIKTAISQKEVRLYLENKYPDIYSRVNKIISGIQQKDKKSKIVVNETVDTILDCLAECYPHIFILIDDLDKTEDVKLALTALWSYQSIFNDWKRSYRVVLIITGKEEWVNAFEELAEFSGIAGKEIHLSDWGSSEAQLLVDKRLNYLEIIPSPFSSDAYQELINLGIVTPRNILRTCEKILIRASERKIKKIGSGIVKEISYWSHSRKKELIKLNLDHQKIWQEIGSTIPKHQEIENTKFGILLETASRNNFLPIGDLHDIQTNNKLPRLHILNKKIINFDLFLSNIKDLEKMHFIEYDKRKNGFKLKQKFHSYFKDLLTSFDIDHIRELGQLDILFETKSLASPSIKLEITEEVPKKGSIDSAIIELLFSKFEENPTFEVNFDVIKRTIKQNFPELESLFGKKSEMLSKRLYELQEQGKIISPKQGFWKIPHEALSRTSKKFHQKNLGIRIDKFWSIMEYGDQVYAFVEAKKIVDELFTKIVSQIGQRYSNIKSYKDFFKIINDLDFDPAYIRYIESFYTIISTNNVEDIFKRGSREAHKHRKINIDQNLINSSLNLVTEAIIPKLDSTLSNLTEMNNSAEKKAFSLFQDEPQFKTKIHERIEFYKVFEGIFKSVSKEKSTKKAYIKFLKALTIIIGQLRILGYISEAEMENKLPEHISFKLKELLLFNKYILKGSLFSCTKGDWKIAVPFSNKEINFIRCTRHNCSEKDCSVILNPVAKDLIIAKKDFDYNLGKVWMEETVGFLARYYGFNTHTGVMYNRESSVLKEPLEIDCIIALGEEVIVVECKDKDVDQDIWNDWNNIYNAIVEQDRKATKIVLIYTGKVTAKIRSRTDIQLRVLTLEEFPNFLEEIFKQELAKYMKKNSFF